MADISGWRLIWSEGSAASAGCPLLILILQQYDIALRQASRHGEMLSIGRPCVGLDALAGRTGEMKIRKPLRTATCDRLQPQIIDASFVDHKSDVLSVGRDQCPVSAFSGGDSLRYLAAFNRNKVEFLTLFP